MGVVKTAKLGVLKAARFTGAASLLMRSSWRNNRMMILAYHGISTRDEHIWNPGLFVSAEQLRRRFELLREMDCTVLPLDEALVRVQQGDLPPRTVVLTFDDGNHDFASVAVPILEDFALPATVYLTTYYCENRYTVFNVACRYLAWRSIGKTVDYRALLGDTEPTHLGDAGEAERFSDRLRQAAIDHDIPAPEMEELLCSEAGFGATEFERVKRHGLFHIMAPEAVIDVSKRGFAVELHTHRHKTPEERDLFEREIQDNRAVIERLTGKNPRHFCYPSGVYRRQYLDWLPELGVISGTTCEPDLTARDDDPLLLPRFVDSGAVREEEFVGWISGVSTFMPVSAQWRRGARF